MSCKPIERCRACGNDQLAGVLDLGLFAISDFLDTPDAFHDRAPLVLVRCEDCTLVQLRHTVDRDRLYRRYWYRSGTQPAMVRALREVVDEATRRVTLRPGDAVIDIGANDGTLLRMYPKGLVRIAYEPAENLWPLLQGSSRDATREIAPIFGYFPTVADGKPVGMEPKAKIITSIACFYDVDDPNLFIEGIKANLADDGVWINQLAYLPDTLWANNFGDICHEHLTYWDRRSFAALLDGTGLHLQDYSYNDVNGGSIRMVVGWTPGPAEYDGHPGTPASDLQAFQHRIERQRFDILQRLVWARGAGKQVVGYGASTKGNTYLQYWGITSRLMPYIADRNPEKWGKYTPTGQKVISEDEMRAMKPDYLLVLPWHFAEAFIERERDLLDAGTKMIVPFPEPRLHGRSRGDASLFEAGTQAGV